MTFGYNIRMMTRFRVRVLLVASVLAVGTWSVLAQMGVAGVWSGEVELPNGNRLPFVARLAVEGNLVTGTLDGIGGAPDVTIADGRLEGNTVTFTGVREIQGEPVTFSYTGELDGETLTFTIEREGAAPLTSVTRRGEPE